MLLIDSSVDYYARNANIISFNNRPTNMNDFTRQYSLDSTTKITLNPC